MRTEARVWLLKRTLSMSAHVLQTLVVITVKEVSKYAMELGSSYLVNYFAMAYFASKPNMLDQQKMKQTITVQ